MHFGMKLIKFTPKNHYNSLLTTWCCHEKMLTKISPFIKHFTCNPYKLIFGLHSKNEIIIKHNLFFLTTVFILKQCTCFFQGHQISMNGSDPLYIYHKFPNKKHHCSNYNIFHLPGFHISIYIFKYVCT